MFRLDRTAFRINTFEEADSNIHYWVTRPLEERLRAADFLTRQAYNIAPDAELRLDRTKFWMGKLEDQDKRISSGNPILAKKRRTMSAAPKLTEHYTPDEFFTYLEGSLDKYEYEAGKLTMMAGGTGNHNTIKSDLAVSLGSHARQNTNCEFFDSDQATYIPNNDAYVFPDLTFVCGDAQFQDEARRRLLNPALLIEVMSESSELYDRSGKFHKYKSLGSFREYVLVDSQKHLVESFYKQDKTLWQMATCFDPNGSVYIHTLDIDLPMAEIYRRVTF